MLFYLSLGAILTLTDCAWCFVVFCFFVIAQHLLLVEIFKSKENLNPSFMKGIFVERTENYNLRSGNTLQLPKARTTTYGIESVSFLGSLLWHALKKSENLAVFKRKLRSWNGLDCKCRLCRIYIADLGYL